MPGNELTLADRVAGALWGMLMQMPSQCRFTGLWWRRSNYKGIRKAGERIQKPTSAKGSFRIHHGVSSTGGAGRGGTSDGDIIGSVINHGKKQYWERGGGYHYHCTLQRVRTL